MKKLWLLIPVLLFVGLVALNPTPDPAAIQTSAAVQIPQALTTALNAMILTGMLIGLQVVFDYVGLDLRGLAVPIAATLSAFALGEIQGYIDAIPAAYDQIVTIVLNVLVVILSGLGTLRALFHRERAATLLPYGVRAHLVGTVPPVSAR